MSRQSVTASQARQTITLRSNSYSSSFFVDRENADLQIDLKNAMMR